MNDSNNFGMNSNYNIGENNNMENEPIKYDSYYNHQPRKKPWPLILVVIIIIIIAIISLWVAGVFTPVDRQAEYDKLYKRVCNAAITYADKNKADAKKTTGKVVYITTGTLAAANLIESNLRNYLTNEYIPITTNVKLEVLPSKTFQCNGFLWPGDDTKKPVITLVGDSEITSPVGTVVTDPGATATDNEDGNITDRINRSGNVDINNAGTYYIYYSVSDVSGNLADTVTRTYIIQ